MPYPNSILSRMIIREIFPPFILSFSAVSMFLLLGRMLVLLQPLLMAGVSGMQFMKFVAIILPSFFGFSIPIATLLGNLLAFMRLSRDSELMALLCCGVNFRQILKPVITLTGLLWIISLSVTILVVPASKTAYKTFLRNMTEKILDKGLPERLFFSPVDGLTFYVNSSSDSGKKFRGVFISDDRKTGLSNEIIAARGKLVADETGKKAMLVLNTGVMTIVDTDGRSMDYMQFKKYALKLQISGKNKRKSRGEMNLLELYKRGYRSTAAPDRRNKYRIELQKRLAIPCGVLLMGLMAVPLGCLFGRTGLSGGMAIGLTAFLSYYMMMELAASMAANGIMPAEAAIWIPNMAAGAAVYLLLKKLYQLEGGRR